MRRKLVLSKETLSELTTAELVGVAGGALTPKCPTFEHGCRVPTDHCVSVDYTCLVSQLMVECFTAGC